MWPDVLHQLTANTFKQTSLTNVMLMKATLTNENQMFTYADIGDVHLINLMTINCGFYTLHIAPLSQGIRSYFEKSRKYREKKAYKTLSKKHSW